jgi:tetratricopeptide (TPR) repeat protein
MRFDDDSGDILLQAEGLQGIRPFKISLRSQDRPAARLDSLSVAVDSFRFADSRPAIQAKVSIIQDGDVQLSSWLEEMKYLQWRGHRLTRTGSYINDEKRAVIELDVKKRTGSNRFTIAFLLLLLLTGLGAAFLAGRRNLVFPFMALLLALALLEVGAHDIEWLRDRIFPVESPYVDQRNPVPLFERVDLRSGEKVYQRTAWHSLVQGGQSFAAEKPEKSIRIFIAGGSAAAGWPYHLGDSNIRGFLQKKLQLLFPDHLVEVINAAGGTYGSHRVAALVEEIIAYQPDLVILYCGNNEFLENFVFKRAAPPGMLKKLALARLVYDLAGRLDAYRPSYSIGRYTLADQSSNRIAFAFGKSSQYRKNPDQFRQLAGHYRYNIDRMATLCRNKGVTLMILNVPVNLRDWIPNASQHSRDLSAKEISLWRDVFRKGYLALESTDNAAAARYLENALQVDDEHAENHYYLGVARHHSGDHQGAKASFLKALERDAYPFRALPLFQEVLEDVAEDHGVPLVDIVSALEKETKDGILGNDVLLDYVHPTRESQEIIAHEIIRVMESERFFPEEPALAVESVRIPLESTFLPYVEAQAMEMLYTQNLIMRQYDKLDKLYLRYVSTIEQAMAADPSLTGYARSGMEIINALHPVVSNYSLLLRAEKLGILEEEYSEMEAREVYGSYIDMIQMLEAPAITREAFLEQVPPLKYKPHTKPGHSSGEVKSQEVD